MLLLKIQCLRVQKVELDAKKRDKLLKNKKRDVSSLIWCLLFHMMHLDLFIYRLASIWLLCVRKVFNEICPLRQQRPLRHTRLRKQRYTLKLWVLCVQRLQSAAERRSVGDLPREYLSMFVEICRTLNAAWLDSPKRAHSVVFTLLKKVF